MVKKLTSLLLMPALVVGLAGQALAQESPKYSDYLNKVFGSLIGECQDTYFTSSLDGLQDGMLGNKNKYTIEGELKSEKPIGEMTPEERVASLENLANEANILAANILNPDLNQRCYEQGYNTSKTKEWKGSRPVSEDGAIYFVKD